MDSVSLVKFISLLIYPVGLVSVLFVMGVILRIFKLRKCSSSAFFVAVAVFFTASNPLIAKKLVQGLEWQFPQQDISALPNADTILVLGGGLRLPIEPRRFAQLHSASDRYWLAAQIFKQNKADNIVLSGGNVFEQENIESEAFYAKQLLSDWGVSPDKISIESDSRTTFQNAQNTQAKVDGEGKIILLVTSAWHMPRSIKEFQRYKANVIPVSADVLVDDFQAPGFYDWLPSVQALAFTTLALHEYYGMWFSKLRGWLKAR